MAINSTSLIPRKPATTPNRWTEDQLMASGLPLTGNVWKLEVMANDFDGDAKELWPLARATRFPIGFATHRRFASCQL